MMVVVRMRQDGSQDETGWRQDETGWEQDETGWEPYEMV